MRRIKKYNHVGDRRVISWFALLPVTVVAKDAAETTVETRWMERVEVGQEYRTVRNGPWTIDRWVNVRFVDGALDALREL